MYLQAPTVIPRERLLEAAVPLRRRTAADRRIGGLGALGQAAGVMVSIGEFGRALRGIGIPPKAVQLLRLSPTFMKMVAVLDAKYVYIWNPAETRHRTLPTSADGIVTTGAFAGRRVINVRESQDGSRFEAFTSPSNPGFYDVIWITRPRPSETGAWLELVAHETAHAVRAVSQTPPTNTTARIRAAVDEEISARKIEATVLAEILKTTQGKVALGSFQPATGSTAVAIVERDFFPLALRRTYLEHFVLSELAQAAVKKERLDATAIQKKDQEVSQLPLTGWRARRFASDYAKVRFWMRVIHFRWQRVHALRGPGTPEFEQLKETVLQEHANAFFSGLAKYTSRP